MKQYLLFGCAAMLATGVWAVTPSVVSGGAGVRTQQGHVAAPTVRGDVRGLKTLSGEMQRKAAAGASERQTINPRIMKAPARAAALPEGMKLYESFEDCPGNDINWLPEGWSTISAGDPDLEDGARWGVQPGGYGFGMPDAPEGHYYAAIGFSMSALSQDEYLVLPEVAVDADNELKFQLYVQPVFFYDISAPGVVDWDNYTWGDVAPEKNGDLTVVVKAEGDDDWTEVWSMLDQFEGYSLEDIMMYGGFSTFCVPLAEYAGEKVQMAFRYRATDCDTVLLDCISVGLPSLEGVSYTKPFETLYWGFDNSEGWSALNFGVAQYPVYGPLTWYNNYGADATYSWSYMDPVTNDWATSDDQDALTLTYVPDYTSEFTCRNNFFYPPVLNATAPGASDGSYTMPVEYMAAGGKPEFMTTDGSMYEFGLLPFDVNNDGFSILTVDADNVGDIALPIFGYNANSNRYWLDYTLNGQPAEEGYDVRMVSILNFIYSPAAPLVVTGVHVNGYGNVSDNAEFKIEIIPCVDYQPLDEAIATAVCRGADMMRNTESGLPYPALNIPFSFETPAVLDNSYNSYIVKLSGFNSPEVEYFIPIQSLLPNADGLCHGWIEKQIKIDSDYYRTSYSPMANVRGEYGDCYNAFAINLEGYYPWLECDAEEVGISSDGIAVEVNLGSYYDGSELTVSELPGLVAKTEGRYDRCVLTLSHDNTDVLTEGEITISAPGVEKTLRIKNSIVGVEAVGNAEAEITGIYAPDGTRVSAANAEGGLYIIRYSDGTARKEIRR